MKRFLSFLPGAVTDPAVPSKEMLTLRKQALQTILLITSLYCVIHINIALKSSGNQIEVLLTAGLLFFTIVSLTLFFFQNLSFNVRLTSLIILCYLQATLLVFTAGWGILPMLFLLIFAVLCAISIRARTAIIGSMVNPGTIILWAILASKDVIPGKHAMLALEAVLAGLLLPAVTLFLRSLLSRVQLPATQPLAAPAALPTDSVSTTSNVAPEPFTSALLKILAGEKDGIKTSQQICDLLKQTLELYHAGVYQIDNAREYAVLQYGTGDEGVQMLNASYRLSVGGFSQVGKAIQSAEIKSAVLDESDPSRFENPFLPESRSETAVPLIINGESCGALDVHLKRREELDEARLQMLQQAAYALSVSLEKTRSGVFTSILQPAKPSAIPWRAGSSSREFESSYINPSIPAKPDGKKVELPVLMRNEKVGSLELQTNGQSLNDEQSEFIQNATTQALTAIENICRLERVNRQAELERTVFEISSKLHATNNSRQILQIALQEISKNLGVSKAQIVLNVPESPQAPASPSHETRLLAGGPGTGPLVER